MGRKICPVTKSNQSNSVFPKNVMLSPTAPSDNEQNAPMTAVAMVTMSAAFFRVIINSSWKNAVDTSCSDISEVRAANDSSTKNSSEMT